MEQNDNNDAKLDQDLLERRKFLGKYGAYTAPAVVSLLLPSTSYASMNGIAYSLTTCTEIIHPPNNMGQPMTSHCEMFH